MVQTKADIRTYMAGRLEQIGSQERTFASHKASVALIKSAAFMEAHFVLSYMATDRELDPFRVTSAALGEFKRVAFPRCIQKTHDLSFYLVRGSSSHEDFLSQFEAGPFGILEPHVQPGCLFNRPPVRQKKILVIVPGVAFSYHGGRLGHGKGYYDRYLDTLRMEALSHDCTLTLAGFCFDEQIVSVLPEESHDIRMDCIATPSGVFSCTR